MSPKPKPPKPWLSGHCNADNPPEIHRQCHGSFDGRPCKCTHHAAERLLAHATGLHHSADAVLTFGLDGIGWEDTARAAAELKKAREAISAAEEFLAKHVADQWPSAWRDEQHLEGVGAVNPHRPIRSTWDTDETIKSVVKKHMEDAGGEVPDPLIVAKWIADVAHIDYFRSRDVGALGIDVSELRTFEKGNVRLRIKLSDHMVGDTTREEGSA